MMSEDERKPPARRTKRAKLKAGEGSSSLSSEVCFQDLPGEIKKQFFGFLDVKTLCIQREVSREWKQNCEQAIEDKKKEGAGVFTTTEELCEAVNDYYECKYEEYDADLAEKVARDYGWAIGRWNVSAVTDFSNVFEDKERFNDPIGDWSVGNGTTFEYMFWDCHAFDQDLSKWKMDNAVDLEGMFGNCKKFNQNLPWNTSNVKIIRSMFEGASSFNGIISSWNTANVVNAQSLFIDAAAFSQDISRWDMSSCKNMKYMFERAVSFNKDVSHWCVSNVLEMDYMFCDATAFCQDLSAWDVSNVESMESIFRGSGVTRETLSSWEGWDADEENNYKLAF
jgi:hypothetical protein